MAPKLTTLLCTLHLQMACQVGYMISYLNADETFFPLLFSTMPAWNYKQIILSVYV